FYFQDFHRLKTSLSKRIAEEPYNPVNFCLQFRKEGNREGGPLPRRTLSCNHAALPLHDGLGQREAQADAGRIQGLPAPVKPLEDVVDVLRGNAAAVVGYLDLEHGGGAGPGNPDMAAGRRVIQGVLHQISQSLAGPLWIAE